MAEVFNLVGYLQEKVKALYRACEVYAVMERKLQNEIARLERDVATLEEENQELRDEATMGGDEAEEVFGEIAADLLAISEVIARRARYIQVATRRSH